ncbi:hypothetical protein ACRAWF_15125 [Streptomyces sp. L7]
MTEYQRRTVVGAEAVTELADRIGGSVFVPGDDGYEAAIAGFNPRSRRRPRTVVAAGDAADVRTAVALRRPARPAPSG